jgi:hypothetical protein
MKDAEHDEPIPLDAILKDVGNIQNLQNNLPILFATGNWMAEQRLLD